MKVGVRNGEVILTVTTERDHKLLKAMIDPGWQTVTAYGEDVTEELHILYEKLDQIEWA